jgi:hypothetical protein
MSEMTLPESRAYLGHLMAEMLSLPNLPSDLHLAITTHLQQQFSHVNILKPEYCRRLYPITAELAELAAINNGSQSEHKVTSTDAGQKTANLEEPTDSFASRMNELSDLTRRYELTSEESVLDAELLKRY